MEATAALAASVGAAAGGAEGGSAKKMKKEKHRCVLDRGSSAVRVLTLRLRGWLALRKHKKDKKEKDKKEKHAHKHKHKRQRRSESDSSSDDSDDSDSDASGSGSGSGKRRRKEHKVRQVGLARFYGASRTAHEPFSVGFPPYAVHSVADALHPSAEGEEKQAPPFQAR